MADIFVEFPKRDDILGLSTEALAERMLLDLSGGSLHRGNFLLDVGRRYGEDDAVTQAYAQAWALLGTDAFSLSGANRIDSSYLKTQKQRRNEFVRGACQCPHDDARWLGAGS